jgi:hypothetical protein
MQLRAVKSSKATATGVRSTGGSVCGQKRSDQEVTRPDAGADIAQLIDRDNHCRDGQLDVHPVQQGAEDRAACLDEPAHQPRRLCECMVGQERVLVQDRRPHGRGDAQPRVAHFGRDDEQESERDRAKGGGAFGPRPEPPRHHGQSREHDHRPVAERQHAAT